jgi:3-oxoacyl-[acyl-carrier-protein] synthase II
MGEEMAGLAAIENAFRRIAADQADLVLVGGALNAEREDLLLGYEIGRNLWRGPYLPVWHRRERGGGFIPGSVGAFLMLESRSHAEMRGARAYARIAGVATDRCDREPGDVTRTMSHLFERLRPRVPAGPLPVLSGASGVEPVTSEEMIALDNLSMSGIDAATRAFGNMLGHSVEAQFPAGVALAALSVRHGVLPPPSVSTGVERPFSGALDRVLVTGVGHWRGEGMALVEKVD